MSERPRPQVRLIEPAPAPLPPGPVRASGSAPSVGGSYAQDDGLPPGAAPPVPLPGAAARGLSDRLQRLPGGPRAGRALALLLAAAVGYGVAHLQQAQRDARAQRAAEQVLALRVEPRDEGVEVQDQGVQLLSDEQQRLLVRLPVRVVNTGPRPVVLRSLTVPGAGLQVDGAQLGPLDALGDAEFALQGTVACPGAGLASVTALHVTATTVAGERAADPPIAPALVSSLSEQVRRACGIVPVDEALELAPTNYAFRPDGLVVTLRAENRSSRPVRIKRLDVAPGLRAQLLGRRGRPAALPVTVPAAAPGRFEPHSYDVRLAVVPGLCASARQAGPELFQVTYNQDEQDVGVSVGEGDGTLAQVVRAECP